MTPPDVQNVPDVWGLLAEAYGSLALDNVNSGLLATIELTLAQRDRFVLVPKEPTVEQLMAIRKRFMVDIQGAHMGPSAENSYRVALAAAPKPEGKL